MVYFLAYFFTKKVKLLNIFLINTLLAIISSIFGIAIFYLSFFIIGILFFSGYIGTSSNVDTLTPLLLATPVIFWIYFFLTKYFSRIWEVKWFIVLVVYIGSSLWGIAMWFILKTLDDIMVDVHNYVVEQMEQENQKFENMMRKKEFESTTWKIEKESLENQTLSNKRGQFIESMRWLIMNSLAPIEEGYANGSYSKEFYLTQKKELIQNLREHFENTRPNYDLAKKQLDNNFTNWKISKEQYEVELKNLELSSDITWEEIIQEIDL